MNIFVSVLNCEKMWKKEKTTRKKIVHSKNSLLSLNVSARRNFLCTYSCQCSTFSRADEIFLFSLIFSLPENFDMHFLSQTFALISEFKWAFRNFSTSISTRYSVLDKIFEQSNKIKVAFVYFYHHRKGEKSDDARIKVYMTID